MTDPQYTRHTLAGFSYHQRLHNMPADDAPIVVVMYWMTGADTVMDFLFEAMPTPARLIFLQANYPSGHEAGGHSWFPDGLGFYEKSDAEQAPLIKAEADKIAALIEQLRQQHPGKLIVTGISQGGDLALHLAAYHGHLVDVAIPCAGRLAEPMRPASVPDTSPLIRMQQGTDDEIVALDTARAARYWLAAQGFDVQLDEYNGVGHNISEDMRARIQVIIAER